jgi:hypothetical protein
MYKCCHLCYTNRRLEYPVHRQDARPAKAFCIVSWRSLRFCGDESAYSVTRTGKFGVRLIHSTRQSLEQPGLKMGGTTMGRLVTTKAVLMLVTVILAATLVAACGSARPTRRFLPQPWRRLTPPRPCRPPTPRSRQRQRRPWCRPTRRRPPTLPCRPPTLRCHRRPQKPDPRKHRCHRRPPYRPRPAFRGGDRSWAPSPTAP